MSNRDQFSAALAIVLAEQPRDFKFDDKRGSVAGIETISLIRSALQG